MIHRGRMREETLERVLSYGERVLRLADELQNGQRPRRVIDQIIGSGTSVGAQIYEAHEAMSRADYLKSLSIAAKELSETRYWLLLVTRMNWVSEHRVQSLLEETSELTSITKAIISRCRKKLKQPKT